MFDLTENQVTNVKRVIFGLQKQANVTNEAVVKIVARGLSEAVGSSCLNTEESVVEGIRGYLQSLVDTYGTPDDTLVMLVAGEASLANLKAVGPKTVYVNQPNEESPKHIFRINMLGDSEVDMSAEEGEVSAVPTVKPSVTPDEVYDVDDDFYTRARKIKAAILPIIPEAVKENIPDNDWAQALCCAEYYYGYNGATGAKQALPETKHHYSASDIIREFTQMGKTIGAIANDYGITLDTVKDILRKRGIDVK